MLPWPEIMTTGASTRRSRSRASVASPSMPGSQMSSTMTSYGARDHAIEAGLAALDGIDDIALVAQHAAERAAHAGFVVDDRGLVLLQFASIVGPARSLNPEARSPELEPEP